MLHLMYFALLETLNYTTVDDFNVLTLYVRLVSSSWW